MRKLILTSLVLIITLSGCTGINDEDMARYQLMIDAKDEYNFQIDTDLYTDFMDIVVSRRKYSIEELNKALSKYEFISNDSINQLKTDIQLYNNLIDQQINDIEHLEDKAEESEYILYNKTMDIVGSTTSYDEYVRHQYETFGIVMDGGVEKETEIVDDTSLKLASLTVYRNKLVYKYINKLGNIQVYSLNLDSGRVVSIDGI